jgi:hypothetical protein
LAVRKSSLAAPAGYVALALGLALGSVSLLLDNAAGVFQGALICAASAAWLRVVCPPAAGGDEGSMWASRWLQAVTTLALAALAAYLAIELRPRVLIDDAAITFRYVDRLVEGLGFTYNDHEQILGTSNPLYTLLLTAMHGAGAGIQDSARVLDTVLLVASVVVAVDIGRRLSNWIGGTLAGLLLAFDVFFRAQALDGLEASLAVLLGLLVVSALVRQRWTLAGVFLGLAVWNKLDAGLLAVAVAGAYVLVCRRPPWRIAAVASAVFAPWLIFALAYFGSPIPRSFTAKLDLAKTREIDHGWIVDFFKDEYRFILLALAAGMVVLAWSRRRARPGEAVAVVALGGWLALHAIFYSAVNLSGQFPWYLTALIPPAAILAAAFVANGLALLRWPLLARLGIVAAGTLVLALALRPQVEGSRRALANDRPLLAFEALDNDRRLAAAWVDRYSRPDEVLESGFGWTAYEVDNPFNDLTGLNSRELLPGDYFITHGTPYQSGSAPPFAPPGYIPLATFNLASELNPGWTWFVVFGRRGSAIERSDHRYLQTQVARLPGAEDAATAAEARFEGFDLVAAGAGEVPVRLSADGQPLHVAFTPVADAGHPVRFVVRSGPRTVYRSTVSPDAPPERVVLPVPASERGRARLVFSTSAPGRWVIPKVVIGDALPRPLESADPLLTKEFLARNPGG